MTLKRADSRARRKVFIKTYGCQMNVYDSERMGEALGAAGYARASGPEDADLVLLNTCHIREKAAEKVYSAIGRLKRLKEARAAEGRPFAIGIAGCVAQAEGEEMLSRAPAVDLVVGPQSYHRLPALLREAEEGARALDTEFPQESKFDALPTRRRSAEGAASAFLTVQEGCDKFCTFCVVPYTRGAEVSRPVRAVLDEARTLAAGGAKEITLLGQNVNAYHGEGPDGRDWSLGRLIRALADLSGIERLRYTTSHPRDMNDELISAHREVPALMPYLHLPVQSGSDRVLKAMNRGHTADDYRRLVGRIREARPDLALSSDFIVGFPGESEADFDATLKLVADVGYAQAYSFKYSERPGTPAADVAEQVPEPVKSERLQRLQALLNAQQAAFNAGAKGTRMKVLFDRKGLRPGQLVGRSPWLQAVHVDTPEARLGEIAEVEIVGAYANSLAGIGVEPHHRSSESVKLAV